MKMKYYKDSKRRILLFFTIVFLLSTGLGTATWAFFKEESSRFVWDRPKEENSFWEFLGFGEKGEMELHVLDVGQGLSILVEMDGKYMLYDGGDREYASKVVAYLKKEKVRKLEYLIASHYDADHINGVVAALHGVKVKHVIGPDYEEDTAGYKAFVKAVEHEKLTVDHPRVGDTYDLGEGSFTILAPGKKRYRDVNDYSVAIRLEYGESSAVITGDATKLSEAEMVRGKEELESDVLVVGHHGSYGSTSLRFLKEVDPRAAIISCEKENPFQHPYKRVMRRLKRRKIEVFRTDKQGDFVLTTDGEVWNSSEAPSNDYSYSKPPAEGEASREEKKWGSGYNRYDNPHQQNTEDKYVLNYNSLKYHRSSCEFVKKISPTNYATTNRSEKKLKKEGFAPCGYCRP